MVTVQKLTTEKYIKISVTKCGMISELILNIQEADELQKEINAALWGEYIPPLRKI